MGPNASRGPHEVAHLIVFAHVAPVIHRPATRRANSGVGVDRGLDLAAQLPAPPVECDVRAFPRERHGRYLADARRRAGDEDVFSENRRGALV